MPPPTPLRMTPGPYILRRRSRYLIEVLGAVTSLGGRDLVAIVDGPEVEANAAGIKEVPALIQDGWAHIDALAGVPGALPVSVTTAVLHATLLRCHP